MIEDFKEYHLLMESHRKTNKKLNNIIEIINKNETPKKEDLDSLKALIENGDFSANSHFLKNIKIIFEKELYTQEEQENIKNKIKENTKSDQKELNEYKKFIEKNQVEDPKAEDPKAEDIATDYQWLYDNYEESGKLEEFTKKLKENESPKNLAKKQEEAFLIFIISDIMYRKLVKSVTEIEKLNDFKVPTVKIDGQNYDIKSANKNIALYAEEAKVTNGKASNFADHLNNLHSIKNNTGKLIKKISKYVETKAQENIDLNDPNVRNKILQDIKDEKIWNNPKAGAEIKATADQKVSQNQITADQISQNQAVSNQEKQTEGTGTNPVKDDPNSVYSLNVNSNKDEVEQALDGTFGSLIYDKDKGEIFKKAIEKANKAYKSQNERFDKDKEYLSNTKNLKKELRYSVVAEELFTNPLLKKQLKDLKENIWTKEEEDTLQEAINPSGNFTTQRRSTHYGNALGDNADNKEVLSKSGDEEGNLEKYRSDTRKKADDIAEKYKLGQAGDMSKKVKGLSELRKLASNYIYELNHKVNKLIKKNDYGAIGSLVRDIKMAKAERIENKNAVYKDTAKGQIKIAETNELKEGLNKLNPEKIDAALKDALSKCAYSKNLSKEEKNNIVNEVQSKVSNSFNLKMLNYLKNLLIKEYSNLLNIKNNYVSKKDQKNLKQKAEEASQKNNFTNSVSSNGNNINKEDMRSQTNWLKGKLNDLFRNNSRLQVVSSVVTENYVFTEEGKPLPKIATEKAILMSLSSNSQEAAEGKQWIIDNVYHGNPLASKIVDEFVKQNSNEKGKAKEVLKVMNKQQTKFNNQTNISQQNIQPNIQQQPINQQTNTQQNINQTTQNTNPNQQTNVSADTAQPDNSNQQAINNGTPQQVTNATVTTGAADGFPNRLYKKIIKRKIGF